MKKTALVALASLIIALGAQAQGLVTFGNSSSAGSKVSTNNVTTGVTQGPVNSFYYALFYSTTQTAVGGQTNGAVGLSGTYAFNAVGWTFAGGFGGGAGGSGYATNTASTGRVFGAGPFGATQTDQAVNGLAGGASAQFVVVGWSANIGTTYQQLQTFLAGPSGNNGLYFAGESPVSSPVVVGDGALVGTPTIMAASGAVPGFVIGVVPVPEPATIALAGLGGLSLLALRRRNSK